MYVVSFFSKLEEYASQPDLEDLQEKRIYPNNTPAKT